VTRTASPTAALSVFLSSVDRGVTSSLTFHGFTAGQNPDSRPARPPGMWVLSKQNRPTAFEGDLGYPRRRQPAVWRTLVTLPTGGHLNDCVLCRGCSQSILAGGGASMEKPKQVARDRLWPIYEIARDNHAFECSTGQFAAHALHGDLGEQWRD
jgi:hypothetical protein